MRIFGKSNEIVQLRLDDAAERPITQTPNREETWPYWSTPAARLVYQVSTGRGRSDLVLWSPDGGEEPLVTTPGREERWPVWSPTRPELVYAFRGGEPASGLARIEPRSGRSSVLAASGARDFFLRASFAADGRSLVAQRRRAEDGASAIWLLEPGSPPRPLLADASEPSGDDVKPRFSRDAALIFFSRRPRAGGPHDVMRAPASGGEPTPVASLPGVDDHSAAPSPTRDEIAFVSNREGRPLVYLAALDGSGLRRLSDASDRSEFAPRWSPDGEWLAITTSPADAGPPKLVDRRSLEATRIVVMDREGGRRVDVRGMMPDWMPPWP